ncbi:MAG: sensor histidine kinase [Spirochaetia bacterium]
MDISLPTRTAISLGLIINEIATNTIKHGFIDGKPARFSIDLIDDEGTGEYTLTLSNTGKPFPEEIDIENTESLGLQLVSSLVNQLEGTMTLKRSPYPVFTIHFPGEAERWSSKAEKVYS